MPQQGEAKRSHAAGLDGLRAVCALAVMGYHMGLGWLSGGYLGVTVLFVLSGYLVTSGLLREHRTRGSIDLKGFYVARLRRLMPTVAVFLVVITLLCGLFNHIMLTKLRPDMIPALTMTLNWWKIFSQESYFAAAGSPSPVTHFWSLAIEMQLYLIWAPALGLVLDRGVSERSIRRALVALAAVSAVLMALLYVPGADPSRVYYGTDTRALGFLMGSALAFWWPFDSIRAAAASTARRADRVFGRAGIVGFVVLLIVMVFAKGYTSFTYYGGDVLVTACALAAIAALVLPGSALSRALSAPPLAELGKRSYALYVWHYPIVELLTVRNAALPTPIWRYLLMAVVSLVLAELSYRFVELPFRKLPAVDVVASAVDSAGRRRYLAPSYWMRRRLPILACAAAVTLAATILAAAVPPQRVGGGAPEDKRIASASLKKPLADGVYDVVVIGDSVCLNAYQELAHNFSHGLVDVEGSRQAPAMLERMQELDERGVLGDTVVFHCGTNGVLDDALLDSMVAAAGPEREVWFINLRSPYPQDDEDNACIERCAERHENVGIIDWHGFSEGRSDILQEDGIHLQMGGEAYQIFADLVRDSIGYLPPEQRLIRYEPLFLGDLTALGAADALATSLPNAVIDCAEDRSTDELLDVYATYEEQDVVGEWVVLALGSTGSLSQGELDRIIARIGGDHKILLVTDRTAMSWCEANNAVLAACARQHDNVELLDWHALSAGKTAWFAEDGQSLTEEGAKAYAEAIAGSCDTGPVVPTAQDAEATADDATADDDAAGENAADAAGTAQAG